MAVEISCSFPSGSIDVLSCDDPAKIELSLRDDNLAAFKQWFHYRVDHARDTPLGMTIRGVSEGNRLVDASDLPDMWAGYRALASYDLEEWFRVPTSYDGEDIRIAFTPERDRIHIATFAPYTLDRHRQMLGRISQSPLVRVEMLGRTPDGHDLDLVTIGTPDPDKKALWVVTRQHPSETQGSWFVEGLIERLIDEDDARARALLAKGVFYIMPNLNPDGTERGNTRTNALGVNLNRMWFNEEPDRAPEIALMRAAMDERGVSYCLDVHSWAGDKNFMCGPYHTPSITPLQTELKQRYEIAMARNNPDFEVGVPFPGGGPKPGQTPLGVSWNYVTEFYGAFGVIYELLNKEKDRRADAEGAWSHHRCKHAGATTIDAIAEIIDQL